MQLDVDIEPTFTFSYMKCIDKQKYITMKLAQTDRQTENGTLEPIVQVAQVGSKMAQPFLGSPVPLFFSDTDKKYRTAILHSRFNFMYHSRDLPISAHIPANYGVSRQRQFRPSNPFFQLLPMGVDGCRCADELPWQQQKMDQDPCFLSTTTCL